MVHALEKAHELLQPEGVLVDIHPSGEPPPIVVRLGKESYLAGWLREEDDYVEYAQADAALETHATAVVELREFLARTWEDAIIDDGVAQRATDLLQSAPTADKEVVLQERIRIGRYRKLGA